MNTTNYILELLISGISSFIWLFLFSLSILGTDTLEIVNYLDDKDRIIIAFLVLPIIYTFGVLIDRLVDNIFDKFFNLKLRKKFFENENLYREARSNIYINSVSLTNLFEYGRIRIRISRNWTFNGLLIYTSSIIFLWTSTFTSLSFIGKWKYTIVISFILIPSIILAYNSWKSLNKKEYSFLKIQNKIFTQKNRLWHQKKSEK